MPGRPVNIIKSSGNVVPFSIEKLQQSLRRSGANEDTIRDISGAVEDHLHEGMTTRNIYQYAYKLLKKKHRHVAGKYSLKKAIMELGPTGFPFEKFIGELLERIGYKVKIDQFLQGKCVKHEIDIIAENETAICIIECKYHNSQSISCDVKVPLYVDSRFRDVKPAESKKEYQGWVVTNTQFTIDAIQYGTCAGLHLLAWDYPEHKGIKEIADEHKIYPVTCLTTLSKKEKELLLENGIILCKDLVVHSKILSENMITGGRMENIIREAMSLSGM